MSDASTMLGIDKPTPLRHYPRLSEQLGVSLWVKHDDLFPVAGGGNKARKLRSILNDGIRAGCDALVTTGSYHSNHVRAAALMAAHLGWRSKMIIHDEPRSQFQGNLLLADLAGAEIRFCTRMDVADRMDEAMNALAAEGCKPLYVWGGGHCAAGSMAYFEAVQELADQSNELNCIPDFVFVASGTGTTQAGLNVGASRFLAQTNIIGVSVAHEKTRGEANVRTAVDHLLKVLGERLSVNKIVFDERFLFGGYAKASTELYDAIRWAARSEGLILDPVYSGKAFAALRSYVKAGLVSQGSTVCFWHTGGIFTLLGESAFAHELQK